MLIYSLPYFTELAAITLRCFRFSQCLLHRIYLALQGGILSQPTMLILRQMLHVANRAGKHATVFLIEQILCLAVYMAKISSTTMVCFLKVLPTIMHFSQSANLKESVPLLFLMV